VNERAVKESGVAGGDMTGRVGRRECGIIVVAGIRYPERLGSPDKICSSIARRPGALGPTALSY
jgi:hypothetical protein